jgi:hypothetical protein
VLDVKLKAPDGLAVNAKGTSPHGGDITGSVSGFSITFLMEKALAGVFGMCVKIEHVNHLTCDFFPTPY